MVAITPPTWIDQRVQRLSSLTGRVCRGVKKVSAATTFLLLGRALFGNNASTSESSLFTAYSLLVYFVTYFREVRLSPASPIRGRLKASNISFFLMLLSPILRQSRNFLDFSNMSGLLKASRNTLSSLTIINWYYRLSKSGEVFNKRVVIAHFLS